MRAGIVVRVQSGQFLAFARCTRTCSRQLNDVAVSATPSRATTEPSTIVGLRSRVCSGILTDGPIRRPVAR